VNDELPRAATTSTGYTLSAAAWLDTHYLAGQPEYEVMLRAAGFQAGWHVLDAGCCGGSYLPLPSELLAPDGRISAVDLVPENGARVEELIVSGALPRHRAGWRRDGAAVPRRHVAAAWSANVTHYLTLAQNQDLLRRVHATLRPVGT
jgi:cyclopropane fatty-acyl-phospholipid synthase-like methyltransferase